MKGLSSAFVYNIIKSLNFRGEKYFKHFFSNSHFIEMKIETQAGEETG